MNALDNFTFRGKPHYLGVIAMTPAARATLVLEDVANSLTVYARHILDECGPDGINTGDDRFSEVCFDRHLRSFAVNTDNCRLVTMIGLHSKDCPASETPMREGQQFDFGTLYLSLSAFDTLSEDETQQAVLRHSHGECRDLSHLVQRENPSAAGMFVSEFIGKDGTQFSIVSSGRGNETMILAADEWCWVVAASMARQWPRNATEKKGGDNDTE